MSPSAVSSQCRAPCCCFWGISYLIKGWNPCGSWLGNQARSNTVNQYGCGRRECLWCSSSEWLVCATISVQVSFLALATGLVSSKISLGIQWGHWSHLSRALFIIQCGRGWLQTLLKQIWYTWLRKSFFWHFDATTANIFFILKRGDETDWFFWGFIF